MDKQTKSRRFIKWTCVVVIAVALGIGLAVSYWRSLKQRRLMLGLWCVGAAYLQYYGDHSSAPSSFEDIQKSRHISGIKKPGNASAVANAIEMIQDGRLIIVWDAVLTESPVVNNKYVLGYEVNAAINGGYFIRGDGVVDYATSSEFNALSKVRVRNAR